MGLILPLYGHLKAQEIIQADFSGVLETDIAADGWAGVRLREGSCDLVLVHRNSIHHYVQDNRMCGWKNGETYVVPKRRAWIVLTLFPSYHPWVVQHGPIASFWAVIPLLK